jgi:hypothetical protein
MRVDRLAQLFERKYDLQAEAASTDQIRKQINKDVVLTYNLYVNGETAKEPVIQMLANAGETFSKTFIGIFKSIAKTVQESSNTQLYTRLNNLMGMIHDAKQIEGVRKFIHDSVRVTKESERNYREHLKSKFEMVIHRVTSLLDKQLKLLKRILPKGMEVQQEGGVLEPQRKELSKEKLLMFMRTPAAQYYHLDDMDTMYQVLSDPIMKDKLTTLINAISRGHIPADGPSVMSEVQNIKLWLDNRAKNNAGAFEQEDTPTPPSPEDWFDTGAEPEHQVLGDPTRADPSVLEPPQYQQAQKEDAEAAQRKKEWEERMLSKYNSASLYQFLRKV